MAGWVRLCAVEEAPAPGDVREVEVESQTVCLANIEGELHVLENLCPHRQGPLGQGWIEGQGVVCPWHAWVFDCRTGIAEEPEKGQVKVFAVRSDSNLVLVDLG